MRKITGVSTCILVTFMALLPCQGISNDATYISACIFGATGLLIMYGFKD